MNLLHVIQHTSADYLGLMEDHLEGRRIRFRYFRPFTEQGTLPQPGEVSDGLVLLGGGPWGSAGERDVPTLAVEIELARSQLDQGKPVLGVGLGAQILAIAAGGASRSEALRFEVGQGRRVEDDALGGFLPERFPVACYMRDRPVLPPQARVLALDEQDRPVVFEVAPNALGFTGHPGFKTAMAEDLIMEFEESPDDPAPTLQRLQMRMPEMEDSLVPIMTGLIKVTGWMQKKRRIALELKS
ncbi:MAG: gamma-glutamyl-gamma-aminobutyrate hydrolase family protein [Gammaproteobacteria bacterium]|nr:gamma-glutamyl-gamma-aminobutyrate hydrolase family protein [Gammaproteobacteria bacterium]MBT8050950.1 gamma-glutamyl-gamma-aminobutyrate hydrolase family protein [Gammaproteobacteria bacterium]NNJ78640.1 C26 family cysteine hydrolase domain-containing family [Xanthomonadales bacterium]